MNAAAAPGQRAGAHVLSNESLSLMAALLDTAGEARLGARVFGRLATQLARALDASVLSIRLLDPTGRFLDLKASVGVSKAVRARIRRLAASSRVGAALVRRGHVVHSGGQLVDFPLPPSLLRRFRSAALVPIRSDGAVVGALGVGWSRGAPPSASQLRFLDALGRQLGVAIAVVRARETRRKLRTETQLLRKISAALSANLDQREVLEMVTRAAWRLTRAAGAIVILEARDRGQFEIASQSARTGVTKLPRVVGVRFPVAGSLAGRVVRTGRSFRVADTTTDRRPLVHQLARASKMRALLLVPLRGVRGPIGALSVGNTSPRAFSDHDRRVLMQLADQASIAIQNARLFASVRSHRQVLRRLYSQQFTALEAERKRIAHELHDEMGPTLSATLINLQLLKDEAGEHVPARVVETEQLLTGMIDKVRELAYGLHPPMLENIGLVESLQWMIDTYFNNGPLAIEYRCTGAIGALNHDLALALYRIAQEALTNVVKHARARRVRVRLRSSSAQIALHVRDDGCGFDLGRAERKGGFGLASMRERTEQLRGRMAIRSAPGKGCRLAVSFPVEVRGARAAG